MVTSTDSETEDSAFLNLLARTERKMDERTHMMRNWTGTENRNWGPVHDEERKECRQVYYRTKI